MPAARKTRKPELKPLPQLEKELIKYTDAFCKEHLNKEYRDLCRVMAQGLCVEESPARLGDTKTWAAAIIAAVGYVNFLDDPDFKPYISQVDLAIKTGIPKATLNKHRKALIDGFDLIPFDPDFTLPSMIPMNPLVAMLSSPTLLGEDSGANGCCGGACSMEEACEEEDCCKLEKPARKPAKRTKKKK